MSDLQDLFKEQASYGKSIGGGREYYSSPWPRHGKHEGWTMTILPFHTMKPFYRWMWPCWGEHDGKEVPWNHRINLSKQLLVWSDYVEIAKRLLKGGDPEVKIDLQGRTEGEIRICKFMEEVLSQEFFHVFETRKNDLEGLAPDKEADELVRILRDIRPDEFGEVSRVFMTYVLHNNKIQPLEVKSLSFNPQVLLDFKKSKSLDFWGGFQQLLYYGFECNEAGKITDNLTFRDANGRRYLKNPFLNTSFVMTARESIGKRKGRPFVVTEPIPIVIDESINWHPAMRWILSFGSRLDPPAMVHPDDSKKVFQYMTELRAVRQRAQQRLMSSNSEVASEREVDRAVNQEVREWVKKNPGGDYKKHPDEKGKVVVMSRDFNLSPEEFKEYGVNLLDLQSTAMKSYWTTSAIQELTEFSQGKKKFFEFVPSTMLSIFGGYYIEKDGEWLEIESQYAKEHYSEEKNGNHLVKLDGVDYPLKHKVGHLRERPLDPVRPASADKEAPLYSPRFQDILTKAARKHGIPLRGDKNLIPEDPFSFLNLPQISQASQQADQQKPTTPDEDYDPEAAFESYVSPKKEEPEPDDEPAPWL
jgi:hypothetical protein